MPGPSGEQCATCYFWQAVAKTPAHVQMRAGLGMCRPVPPQVIARHGGHVRDGEVHWHGTNSTETAWRVTHGEDDWCGWYRQRPAPPRP